ncbi:hypothetical protein ACFUTX_10070 [Microbacterium sp. NPDC057407]|uniref:hypothetical protein n=1 Tax=Microbacterium sp. NPDC057407 TaxID=3346120 RepID=UPI00366E4D67
MRQVFAAAMMGLVLGMAGCASAPAAPSEPGPGGLTGADPDFATNMQSCLADAGWDVDVTSDGGVQINIPEESESAYDAAVHDCEAVFGYDKPVVLTDAQYGKLYVALTEMVECLRDSGFTVAGIPSEQAFRDGAPFDPYGELLETEQLAPADFDKVQTRCPQP